jgi:hypothetical protein
MGSAGQALGMSSSDDGPLALPGPPQDVAQAQALSHEFACARSISGDHDFAAGLPVEGQEMVALDQELSVEHERDACVPEKVDSANPVLRNPLMQLTASDFHNCRITMGGLISVIDAIGCFRECSPAYAKRLWQEQSQGTKFCTLGIPVEFHQFSSRGGHKSPVTAFNDLLRILALIPGPQGDALRKAQAELTDACARASARSISRTSRRLCP